MLLHLIPQMFACRNNEPECSIIDFRCPELGLCLRGGIEIVARRPYPNKNYLVACRKVGRKAMDGFLIETTERVREFRTITRWSVGAERIVNHHVQYFVLDDDLDAITEKMVLWYAMSPSLGGFSLRWPGVAEDWTPAAAQPRMELISRERDGHYTDSLDDMGNIIERIEIFRLLTVERERVLYSSKSELYDRQVE